MLERIQTLFQQWTTDEEAAPPDDGNLRLAAAALLVEAARADDEVTDGEKARIVALARRHFALTEDEAADLLEAALADTAGVSHLYDHVSVIADHCPPEQRLWIVEMLWQVVAADGRVDPLESSLLRRIGGLLGVSDVERGEIGRRVRAGQP